MATQSLPQPPRSQDLLQSFKQQASKITKPEPKPTVRRRRRRGDGDSGKQLTTAAIADSYVRLCHDPFQDINRWIAEDQSRGRVSGHIISRCENDHDANTTHSMAASRRLCGQPLRRLQGGMDTEEQQRSGAGSLSAGSVADTDRSSRLRPPQAERDRADRGSDLGTADLRAAFRQFGSVATRWQRGVVARAIQQGRAFLALAHGMFSRQPPSVSTGWTAWGTPMRPVSGGSTGGGNQPS
jgi:hypothetical protein